MRSVRGGAPYASFARDNALAQETPVYAFEDLARMFSSSHEFTRADYPTVFALFLAIFIDLFVLLVAIGAAVMDVAEPRSRVFAVAEPSVPVWGEGLQNEITAWVDGALLQARRGMEDRREFLAEVIGALRFDHGTKVHLVPKDARERRFGFLMAHSRAAVASPTSRGDDDDVTFVLEDWVYPALARYLTLDSAS